MDIEYLKSERAEVRKKITLLQQKLNRLDIIITEEEIDEKQYKLY